MSGNGFEAPKVVSQKEWLAARTKLLAKEKAYTHERDALSAERRKLPMVKIDQNYVFDTTSGRKALAELFAGRSQLVVYHFMFGPDWDEGCPSCSLLADHLDGSVTHLAQRDVTLLVVSHAPLEKIVTFKKRMGWRFEWVSSQGSEFNYDFHVSATEEEIEKGTMYYNFGEVDFAEEEMPGTSVFYMNARGDVFHTYSSYARGGEPMIGVYDWLDIVPKGRDEEGLTFSMAWVRHHDRYGEKQVPETDSCCESGKDAVRGDE